jgi:anti-sigma B factor antagonist
MAREGQRAESDVQLDRPSEGISVVRLIGEHDLATKADVADALERAMESGDSIAVDLTAADFVDSSTLHVLVSASRRAAESGRGFSIVLGTNDTIRQVFELTGLLTQLDWTTTVEEAVGALQGDSA